VKSLDMTDRFADILQLDLKKIDSLEQAESVRSQLKQSWLGKLERAQSGDHRWGMFSGVKEN